MRSIARLFIGMALAASGATAFVADTDSAPPTDTAVLTTAGDTSTDTGAEVTELAVEATPSPTPTTGGRAFAAAKKAWVSCVQDAHELHKEGAAARREAGAEPTAFDRETSCGKKPHPRGFGLASSKGHPDDDTPAVEGSSDDDGDRRATKRDRGKGHKRGHTKEHVEDEGDDD